MQSSHICTSFAIVTRSSVCVRVYVRAYARSYVHARHAHYVPNAPCYICRAWRRRAARLAAKRVHAHVHTCRGCEADAGVLLYDSGLRSGRSAATFDVRSPGGGWRRVLPPSTAQTAPVCLCACTLASEYVHDLLALGRRPQ